MADFSDLTDRKMLPKKAPNIALARKKLKEAILLHEKHMNGTAPTTGKSGMASQEKMMEQMESALSALGQ